MVTLTRPTWLKPNQCTLALRKSGLQFVSPFNGTLQAVETLAERWAMSLNMPASTTGVSRSAFFNQWAGGVNLVPLYHFGRPHPLGTLRGAPTLASATARGDSSLQLEGCVGINGLLNGSFELDSNADNLADHWSTFVGGAGDPSRTLLLSRVPTVAAVHGSASQFVQITAASGSGDTGIVASRTPGISPGQAYTISAGIRTGVSGKLILTARIYGAGDSYLADYSSSPVPATGGRVATSVTFTAPSGAVKAQVAIRGINQVGEYFDVDAVQFEAGSAATAYANSATLLADDMISDGTQLYQVASDCTATDAGTMTVPVVNRCRGTVASGTLVLWDRPTALFALPAMEQSTTWLRGGQVDGLVLDAIEVY